MLTVSFFAGAAVESCTTDEYFNAYTSYGEVWEKAKQEVNKPIRINWIFFIVLINDVQKAGQFCPGITVNKITN